MSYASLGGLSRRALFLIAFKYSFPVLLGYGTIGIAFGLLVSGTVYPWWLALVMSLWMFAGAGQFLAVGLFAAGTGIWGACLLQLLVNVRHIAYSLSMFKRFNGMGAARPYMFFSLTDETFALLSSMPEESGPEHKKLMLYTALLNHFYWVTASVIGVLAGSIIPFNMNGISFALTALFVVLMIEQIKKIKKPGIFIVSALAALLAVFFLPESIALLASLLLALALSPLFMPLKKAKGSLS